jgi:beta-lactamase regulating signal transducer with metallopeptidase domain
MDPVMQTLFGKMPIEQLSAVQTATSKNNSANAILVLGTVAIILGATVYVLYQRNTSLKQQLGKLKINDPNLH